MTATNGRLRLRTLTSADFAFVVQLAADPDCVRVLGLPSPASGGALDAWLAAVGRAGAEGRCQLLGIDDGRALTGIAALDGIGAGRARLAVAVAPEARHRGCGRFGAEKMLLYAFQSLRLDRVTATPANESGRALLTDRGFRPAPGEAGALELTRGGWHEHRNAPVLAELHPGLRAILAAELAAGNEILETGRGWPEPASVLVKLRNAFATPRAEPPAGVTYRFVNDPHWWLEEFATESPPHLLVR